MRHRRFALAACVASLLSAGAAPPAWADEDEAPEWRWSITPIFQYDNVGDEEEDDGVTGFFDQYEFVPNKDSDFPFQLGVRDANEGVALRATFIVDPDNVIQHVSVNNLNVGRNPEEVLRILDGLQTDELCPCNRPLEGATL